MAEETKEKAAETMGEDAERFHPAVYPAGPAASGHREEPVGNETIFQNDLDEEWERGQKLAELYNTERENRPDDHPLSLAKAEFDRVEEDREATAKREQELADKKAKEREKEAAKS